MNIGNCNRIKSPQDRLLNIAAEYQKNGNLKSAKNIYMKILRLDPTCASAHYRLGIISYLENRNEKSIKLIDTAVLLEPENFLFRFALSLVLNLFDRKEEAERAWAKGLALFNSYGTGGKNLVHPLMEFYGRKDFAWPLKFRTLLFFFR